MRKMCGVEQERDPNGQVWNSYTYEIRFPQKGKENRVFTGPEEEDESNRDELDTIRNIRTRENYQSNGREKINTTALWKSKQKNEIKY